MAFCKFMPPDSTDDSEFIADRSRDNSDTFQGFY